MKNLIPSPMIQKQCVQCNKELTFFQRVTGELYCDDLCHQQRSQEAVARAKQEYSDIPTARRALASSW